ncbi:hypothetical protein B0J11DRAFT_500681 [Dendryphion nanum]|uniref:Small secreted protein n=1 Tax=Dendryphion nanum TaxID=256645 RepID=A0A9P9EJX0_9PLEO|nr:hypothetical protein B0J11DRAFT_500681 [Dendryphion nanum]
MQIKAFLLTLTASLALAAPVAEPEANAIGSVVKRAVTWVYLCNERNFVSSGYCVHIPAESGICVPLGSDLEDKVSSAGPDQGSYCYFFVDRNCQGDFFHVGNPGYGDLSIVPVNGPAGSTRNFEDKLSSYRCTSI